MNEVPPEILGRLFGWCGTQQAGSLRNVSTTWRRVFDTTHVLELVEYSLGESGGRVTTRWVVPDVASVGAVMGTVLEVCTLLCERAKIQGVPTSLQTCAVVSSPWQCVKLKQAHLHLEKWLYLITRHDDVATVPTNTPNGQSGERIQSIEGTTLTHDQLLSRLTSDSNKAILALQG